MLLTRGSDYMGAFALKDERRSNMAMTRDRAKNIADTESHAPHFLRLAKAEKENKK